MTVNNMNLIQKIMTNNDCFKAGKKIAVKGLMLHSVGCNQPSAMVFINQWNKPASQQGGRQVCVHGFIEPDGDAFQCLPWNHRGWHGGGSSNNTHIGVEMTEPATIKYIGGSSWNDLDPAKTKAHVMGTYKTAVELFAFLCKEYNLNPLGDGVIISHKEGCARGVASNHGDPEHMWNKYGLTMNQFRQDVKNKMNAAPGTPGQPTTDDSLFRIQTGAFKNKPNAEALQGKLKALGFDTYIVQVGGFFKVQVGAFSVRANADAMMVKLKAAGYDAFITTEKGTPSDAAPAKKSIAEIAQEVLNGKWGNGQDRVNRLTAAGYDSSAVQVAVNSLLK